MEDSSDNERNLTECSESNLTGLAMASNGHNLYIRHDRFIHAVVHHVMFFTHAVVHHMMSFEYDTIAGDSLNVQQCCLLVMVQVVIFQRLWMVWTLLM